MPKALDETINTQHTDSNERFLHRHKISSLDETTEKMFANDVKHLEWMNGVCANLDAPLDRYTLSLRESLILKDFSQLPK